MSGDNFILWCDQFVNTFLSTFPPNQSAYFSGNWEELCKLLQSRPLDYNKIYTLINKMKYEEIDQYILNQNNYNRQTNEENVSKQNTYSRANTVTEDRHPSNQKNSNQSQVKGINTILTAASSPRIVSTNQKSQGHQVAQTSVSTSSVQANNLTNKFSQMDNMQSPKIALSNLSSQQQLIYKNSLQNNIRQNSQNEEFNRHLLLSKTKELLFSLSVSTDKLNAMAKLPMFSTTKDNLNPKSPLKGHGVTFPIQHHTYQVIQQPNMGQQMQQFGQPQSFQNQGHHQMHVNGVKPRGSNHSAEHYSIPQRPII